MKRPEAHSSMTGNLTAEQQRVQRRRAVFRWIRAGGVVIPYDSESNSNFGLADTILEGEVLQITTNLRAIGGACRRLAEYVVYLWNCPLQAEYQLCIGGVGLAAAHDGLVCRIGPACFAGSQPQLDLQIYRPRAAETLVECVSATLVLPRGLCAFIYQRRESKRAPGSLYKSLRLLQRPLTVGAQSVHRLPTFERSS